VPGRKVSGMNKKQTGDEQSKWSQQTLSDVHFSSLFSHWSVMMSDGALWMGRRKEVLATPENNKLLLWLMSQKGNSGCSGSEVQRERTGLKLE